MQTQETKKDLLKLDHQIISVYEMKTENGYFITVINDINLIRFLQTCYKLSLYHVNFQTCYTSLEDANFNNYTFAITSTTKEKIIELFEIFTDKLPF